MTTMTARIVHTTIERPLAEVYAFANNPASMPLWASGLASGLTQDGDRWIANGPLGDIGIVFSPLNDFGVLDHTVTMPSGLIVHNALRLVRNGTGTEVMFTLLQLPDMSDQQFDADAGWVAKDLAALKKLMEGGEGS